MKNYKLINHTADLGMEVTGASKRDLFINCVEAVSDLLTDVNTIQGKMTKRLTIGGFDQVDLLINFLREVLYLFNGECFLIKAIQVIELSDTRITADSIGEIYDPERHTLKMELKAGNISPR